MAISVENCFNSQIHWEYEKTLHGNAKLYCHSFNNKQTCPFATECFFLHEDSEYCKYGLKCERIMRMFKHETEVFEEEFANVEDIETVNENTEIIVIRCPRGRKW